MRAHLSLPGLSLTLKTPNTGRWSEVFRVEQLLYFSTWMSSACRLRNRMRSCRSRAGNGLIKQIHQHKKNKLFTFYSVCLILKRSLLGMKGGMQGARMRCTAGLLAEAEID